MVHIRAGLFASVLIASCLIGAARVDAAAVTLVPPSPTPGQVIPTRPAPYALTFTWRRDTSGCADPSGAIATFRIFGPNGFADTTTSAAAATDAATLTATVRRRSTFTWFVDLACGELTARSALRTFTLTGPNPHPRLAGRYLVSVGGNRQLWHFRPRCAAGACTTMARRPGSGWFALRWNARKRLYTGRIPRLRSAKERVCVLTTRRAGRIVGRRTVRGAYRTGPVRIQIRVLSTRVNPAVTTTWARTLQGVHRGRYIPTARARSLGCPSGGSVGAKLTARRL